MHANCRISARKPGHETLKEIETSYKTSRDTTFGRRELEIRTEAKLQCGKAQKRYIFKQGVIFQILRASASKVTIFNKIRFAFLPREITTKT